ncbi:MAG: glycosyltransferase [Pseudomonadota bacterium]
MDKSGHLKIWVAALTRRRPQMLARLLESWGALEVPQDCSLHFLIVENDEVETSRFVVDAAQGSLPGPLRYVLETEPGIPFGRNRAAREALEHGGDLLVQMDDDEQAAPDWLVNLVEGYRASPARLMGAPLRSQPPKGPLSAWEQFLFDRIDARYRTKERRASRLASLDGTDRVTIVTNNWLAELSLFSQDGIWFDETMRFTGGTDTKFYHTARAKSVPTGWVKDAFVYETIPPERLSFWYQLERGRDQSRTNYRRKAEAGQTRLVSTVMSIVIKSVATLVLALSVPLTMGRTIVDFARSAGWVWGRVAGLMGTRSELYREVTGG